MISWLSGKIRRLGRDQNRIIVDVGGVGYEALLPHSELRDVFDLECRFVDLETLIRLKRAAGRPRRRTSSPRSAAEVAIARPRGPSPRIRSCMEGSFRGGSPKAGTWSGR
mgnify:CR=1 FL=1